MVLVFWHFIVAYIAHIMMRLSVSLENRFSIPFWRLFSGELSTGARFPPFSPNFAFLITTMIWCAKSVRAMTEGSNKIVVSGLIPSRQSYCFYQAEAFSGIFAFKLSVITSELKMFRFSSILLWHEMEWRNFYVPLHIMSIPSINNSCISNNQMKKFIPKPYFEWNFFIFSCVQALTKSIWICDSFSLLDMDYMRGCPESIQSISSETSGCCKIDAAYNV